MKKKTCPNCKILRNHIWENRLNSSVLKEAVDKGVMVERRLPILKI